MCKTVTFCGHRDLPDRAAVEAWLRRTLPCLYAQGARRFYVGGYGAFDAAAAAALAAYDWPGNLRQLKNAVMSATLLAAGEYITCRDLPAEVTGGPAEPAEAPLSLRDPASEEEQIRRALATAGGNKSQAAKLLGIDRKTLYNKLHLYGIE